MNNPLQKRILKHEGYREFPYLDTTGNFTVGIGHKIAIDQVKDYNTGITLANAITLLESDIQLATGECSGMIPCFSALDAIRQGILIEMCFQLGLSGLLAFKKMLAALESGRFDDAAQEMLDSEWHSQTPARCEELANLMKIG